MEPGHPASCREEWAIQAHHNTMERKRTPIDMAIETIEYQRVAWTRVHRAIAPYYSQLRVGAAASSSGWRPSIFREKC